VVPPKLQKDINILCLFVFPLTPESRAAPRRRLQDGTPALIGKTFQPVGFSLSAVLGQDSSFLRLFPFQIISFPQLLVKSSA